MQVFKRVVDVTQPEVVAGLKEALAKEAAELKAEQPNPNPSGGMLGWPATWTQAVSGG